MASGVYERFKANLMNKIVDLVNDDIKVALVNNSHDSASPFDQDVWTGVVDTNEISGTGYTAGGKSLGTPGVTQGATTKFDGDDTVWTTATFSAWHAVLYDDTLAADDLVCTFDFGGEKAVTAGTFTIQWHANGIITLT
jgi:hypothetical protein